MSIKPTTGVILLFQLLSAALFSRFTRRSWRAQLLHRREPEVISRLRAIASGTFEKDKAYKKTLHKIILDAYKGAPYYRREMVKAGVFPSENHIELLMKELPPLTPTIIQEHFLDIIADQAQYRTTEWYVRDIDFGSANGVVQIQWDRDMDTRIRSNTIIAREIAGIPYGTPFFDNSFSKEEPSRKQQFLGWIDGWKRDALDISDRLLIDPIFGPVASSCNGTDFHIFTYDYFYHVKDDRGDVHFNSGEGHLLLTSNHNWSMRFINYATPWAVRFIDDNDSCGCDSNLPRLHLL